ncbi:hypothetical protein V8C26DRAFT_358794 [Trichoderma gracile]
MIPIKSYRRTPVHVLLLPGLMLAWRLATKVYIAPLMSAALKNKERGVSSYLHRELKHQHEMEWEGQHTWKVGHTNMEDEDERVYLYEIYHTCTYHFGPLSGSHRTPPP